MRELRRRPSSKRCLVCKEAIISSRIYCERLGEYVDDLVYCPYFDPKPVVKLQAMQ
ncbi:MAG: hypothetical protein JSW14_06135 [Candidatus Bathyarchaeum sp.]|nr:MAG: hypothetical protein JSW14_06135 [Candidatus Bathyarchaeum sp.]